MKRIRRARLHLLSLISLCFFYNPNFAIAGAHPTHPPTPYVDERVELLSVVFRLAGNPEYHMDLLPRYSADIDRAFAAYKEHAAVKMAHALAGKKDGVGFDAVMAMAICLSPAPELKPLVPFTPVIPDWRWSEADAAKFLPLLREFYRDSRFAEFYALHRPMYELAEQRFTATLSKVDFSWYSRFYGEGPDLTYHLILGMNNGGANYGPRLLWADGRVDLFSIIGCWSHDGSGNPTYPADQAYLPMIIHEFNHSFVNPAVDQHWNGFEGADQAHTILANRMDRMGYHDAKTMVDESLVRAAVIIYFREMGENARSNLKRIRDEQRLGFFWMDQLVDKLTLYEAQRYRYRIFSSYIPQIASFYRDLADRASEGAAEFDARSAHVVRMEPFPNHAQEVDPSIKTLTFVVDKPLDPTGYSIGKGMDGDEHYPIAGLPTFSTNGLRIMVPLQLMPNHMYGFVLLSTAFSTLDGYPLADYSVEFKTNSSSPLASPTAILGPEGTEVTVVTNAHLALDLCSNMIRIRCQPLPDEIRPMVRPKEKRWER